MIKGYEKFQYVGYTLGGPKPTYYFQEGRYTQQHQYKWNEGWHPLEGDPTLHYRGNIHTAAVKEFERIQQLAKVLLDVETDISDVWQAKYDEIRGRMNDFLDRFVNGKITDKDPITGITDPFANFFEYNAITGSMHLSRGKLITPSDPGFNLAYSSQAAFEVLKNGIIAPGRPIEPQYAELDTDDSEA